VGAFPVSGTDQELLEATLAGEESAFLEIYRRYKDQVYRFAYRMTGSPDSARDVTHNCFVGLLEAPSRYDRQRASLGTYLCAAARNQSLRHASRAWRERSVAALPKLRAAPGLSPLETLLEDERARVVREALSALAPLHREVLILAEYEDLDLARIAQIVGAEVGAVKVRLHRARKSRAKRRRRAGRGACCFMPMRPARTCSSARRPPSPGTRRMAPRPSSRTWGSRRR
jgi:RNA polymerase sigma-70 factor (ECF subfamily)